MRLVIGAALGAVLGAIVGYFGKCSTGTCPLTSSPWSGAIFGALIGVMMAQSITGRTSTPAAAGPPPANVREVASEEEFSRVIGEARGPVLVDFFATWCGPCRRMMPELHAVAAQQNDALTVVKVDIDKLPKLAQRYGVQGVPTLFVMDKHEVRSKAVGFRTAEQIHVLINQPR